MCLLSLALSHHPRWQLVMAGNRDELHSRPTLPLGRWEDAPGVIAGRDLRSGGTWAGVGPGGRMAVVTNVRDPLASQAGLSRGALVADYLRTTSPAATQAAALVAHAAEYPPFNLLLADAEGVTYLGNHPTLRRPLGAGVHGMSNGALDTPWPKTRRLMRAMDAWCLQGTDHLAPLWDALADTQTPVDAELPDTGIGIDRERWLGTAFIRGQAYGTRASTVILMDARGHGQIHERRFGPDGIFTGESSATF